MGALLPVNAQDNGNNSDIDNTNPAEALYGEWYLVGWSNEGTVSAAVHFFCSGHCICGGTLLLAPAGSGCRNGILGLCTGCSSFYSSGLCVLPRDACGKVFLGMVPV